MRLQHRVHAFVTALWLAAIPAAAQTFTIHRPFAAGLSVELALPQFTQDPGEDNSALLVTTTLHLRAGKHSYLVITAPYLTYQYRYQYTSPSLSISSGGHDDGLMNLGLAFLSMPGEHNAWEFHLTIPTITDQNAGLGFIGIMSDFDRFEWYLRKNLSLGFYGNVLTDEHSAFVGRVRVGPTAWIPTDDSNDGAEATLDAALGIGVRIGPVEAGAGATTRTILTEEKFMGDKTIVHITLSAEVTVDPLLVQVSYRLPQNDVITQQLNGTWGIAAVLTW